MKKEKTIAKLKKELQVLVNKYVRERDSLGETFKCISCGKTLPMSKCNAGHMFAVKGYNHLRFDLDNINSECMACNAWNDSHLIWYAINLREKIGDEKFNKLLNKSLTPKKEFTREYLEKEIERYKNHFKGI